MNRLTQKIGFLPIFLFECIPLTSCIGKDLPQKTISTLENLIGLPDILEAKELDATKYLGDTVLSYKIRYKSDDCENDIFDWLDAHPLKP